jgi:HlyD family secretion protein/epimerase transport system membrane fusion protein
LLLSLDKTQFQAEYESLKSRYLGLVGQRAKLLAEKNRMGVIEFPPVLSDRTDPEVQRIVTMQEADFRARAISLTSTIGRIQAQLAVVEEELTALTSLGDDGLVSRARIYPLRYSLAELRGQEMEVQLQTDAQRAAELQQVESDLAEVTPKVNAAAVVLAQMDIRATASGKVLGLTQHTVGGIVAAGDKLMDIVPSDTDFVVEAMAKPDDIDDLSPGMEARVQLSALQRNTTPSIQGTVIDVSADRVVTEDAEYYAIKVRINDQELKELGSDVQLYPGMPAEVIIPTHKRTFLQYLVQPITDTVFKSFREP